jgi:hypothetical protein
LYYYTQYANSGSASSSILQPIERTVIELRYGLYDKIELLNSYPYVRQARRYRLGHLLINGKWQSIDQFVPNYHEIMLQKERERLAFERKYPLRLAQYYATLPFIQLYRTARSTGSWALRRMGLLSRAHLHLG